MTSVYLQNPTAEVFHSANSSFGTYHPLRINTPVCFCNFQPGKDFFDASASQESNTIMVGQSVKCPVRSQKNNQVRSIKSKCPLSKPTHCFHCITYFSASSCKELLFRPKKKGADRARTRTCNPQITTSITVKLRFLET